MVGEPDTALAGGERSSDHLLVAHHDVRREAIERPQDTGQCALGERDENVAPEKL